MTLNLEESWKRPAGGTRYGRHPSAGSEDGSPFRRFEAIPTLAPDVPQPPGCGDRQGAVVLLPSRAPGRDGPPVDPAPRGRVQLRPREDERSELEQGPRLLLPGTVVQERDTAPPAHVSAPAVLGRRLAEDVDDGREGQNEELGRVVQRQRARLHLLLRGQDEVVGGCEERGERVGGLSGRERESSAEEELQERGEYVQAGEAVDGEPSGRGDDGGAGARVEHVRQGCRGTRLQETGGREEEREAGKKTRQLHGLLDGFSCWRG